MSSTSSLSALLSSTPSAASSSYDLSSLLQAAAGASSPGIDVTAAVDAAIYGARAPERQWQSEQSTVQSQVTALGSIQSAVSTLGTDLTNLNNPSGALAAKTASSSNTSALTATASGSAATAAHTISIQSLASLASWYSSPLTNASASIGSSNLTISQTDGTQTNFALGSNGLTSLNALAGAINAASIGINASVVTDALGSRLALVSQSSGSASSFSVSDNASTAASFTSASVASPSASLGATTFQVSDGVNSASISVAAGSSLTSVANQIAAAGLNVSASVVTDSSGAHLAISSTNGGSVTVSSDPAVLLTQSSAGADASLTVDGVPVTSASNTVTGAISGVTLTLQGTTNGSPLALHVAADSNQIDSALSQFVTDYNSALSLVNSQFTYNTSTGSQGVLGSDAAVRSLQSALLGISAYSQASNGNASVDSSLASLGITVGDDGSLTLDTTQLNQAVSSNSSAVLNFFQGSALNGFAANTQTALNVFSNPSSGVLAADLSSMTQQYNDLQSNVNNFESGYIASQQTVLTAMYSKAEIALQQLPTTMKQIQSELGYNNSGG